MATNPHGHVINRSSMPQFEESSTRHTFQSEQPLDKLIKAASQPIGNDGSDGQLYSNFVNRPSPTLNSSSSSLEFNRTSLPKNYAESVASKLPRSHYDFTQYLNPPGYQQADTEQPSEVSGSTISQGTTFSPLQSTTNARQPIPAPSHGVLTQDNNVSPNSLKNSPTLKDRNFRYMYLTDNQVLGSNVATAKYRGRLVIKETTYNMHQSESGDSRDAESSSSQKTYACTHKGCAWSFSRPSDLRRHAKSHRAPAFHCPYYANDSSCHRNGGSFARSDVLKRHLRLMHYVRDRQMLYPGTDPGWCRACQKMFESTKTFLDHCSECAAQLKPAVWKTLATSEDSNE